MDKLTGQYYVEIQGEEDIHKKEEEVFDNSQFESRCYMFTKFLHHPGLSQI